MEASGCNKWCFRVRYSHWDSMREDIRFTSKDMSRTQDHMDTKLHYYSLDHDVQLCLI
jgi:hypothetical protein